MLRPGLVIRWQKKKMKLLEMEREVDNGCWWLIKILNGVEQLDYIFIPHAEESKIERID